MRIYPTLTVDRIHDLQTAIWIFVSQSLENEVEICISFLSESQPDKSIERERRIADPRRPVDRLGEHWVQGEDWNGITYNPSFLYLRYTLED